jgi:1-acyl-sn-glycerol-3-phosphate acyltransferase
MTDATSSAARPRRVELGPIALWLYNAWYWPYLFVSCALLFVPALFLFALTAPFDLKRRALGKFTRIWGAHYLHSVPFASVTIIDRERGANQCPCVYVSNHQSLSDVLALFKIDYPFLWVSKIENFYAPFLGWNMWLNNYVPLKRGHLPSIMRMYRTCIRRLGEGHSLFVFPEGTRSPSGQLKDFYPGAFRIAVRNDVPIVPIVLEGTRDILPKGKLRVQPLPVWIKVLDPIHPREVGHDWRRLEAVVRERMLDGLGQLQSFS